MNGSLLIRAFGTNNGGTSGIFFRNGFSTGNYYNCSILTFDHDNNTFTDGLSINAFDGISFCTGANTRQERMRIDTAGNVNIGTTGQNYKLYVNGTTYFNGASTVNGTLTTSNIDCGGGIAINGSTAFYNPSNTIDSGNLTNTYLNLKYAGTDSDWCYLRQIGGNNAFKLAFDFHDDEADARFCIRKIQSTNNPDTVAEVFTVDNGNVSCTGSITANSGQSTIKNYLYIYNPDGRITHLPFSGNNQNYIRGKLNIDQDDLYVGGATTISGRTYCNGGLNIQVNSWVYDTNGSQ